MDPSKMFDGYTTESFSADNLEHFEVMSPKSSPPASPRPSSPTVPKSSTSKTTKSVRKTGNKRIATKKMISEAIKALTVNNRKGFSLAGIRKYIRQNYLATESEIKPRLPYIKKFLKNALENGDLINFKGVGLAGSFRVPSKKPTKSAKPAKRQSKLATKRAKQAGEKRQRKSKKPMKKRHTQFSALL